jgi:hypothetical protein
VGCELLTGERSHQTDGGGDAHAQDRARQRRHAECRSGKEPAQHDTCQRHRQRGDELRNLGCAAGQRRRAKVSTADSAHDRHLKEATPVGYKTACTRRPAQPSDGIGRGPWSQIFGDPQLSALEDELTVSNQNLKLEEARFRQARAMIGCQRTADFRPFRWVARPAHCRTLAMRPIS